MASSSGSGDARELFGAELSNQVPPTHLILKPVKALAGTVTDQMFLHKYAQEARQAVTAGNARTSVQVSRWAREVVEQFQLLEQGCLELLCSTPDSRLKDSVHIAIWEALHRKLPFGMGNPQDRPDAVQQFYLERVERWTRQYDPRKGSFDTFLQARVRPKELSVDGQGRAGLGERREVPTDFTDAKNDHLDISGLREEDVVSRIDAEACVGRVMGPPWEWPDEVRQTHEQGLTPTEIAQALGCTPGAVRGRLRRFHKKHQGKFGGG